MTDITPPVVNVSAGSRTLEIDTGELMFPGLVLAFCLFYYWDTHTLPDLSMLYAGPLLYMTAALAVVTVFQQAVSVDGSGDRGESGLEIAMVAPAPDTAAETTSDDQIFTVRNAALLVALTTVYIVTLEPIGFLIATTGYLAVTLYLFGEESLFVLTLYSIGFTFLLWFVFIEWLGVPI